LYKELINKYKILKGDAFSLNNPEKAVEYYD